MLKNNIVYIKTNIMLITLIGEDYEEVPFKKVTNYQEIYFSCDLNIIELNTCIGSQYFKVPSTISKTDDAHLRNILDYNHGHLEEVMINTCFL